MSKLRECFCGLEQPSEGKYSVFKDCVRLYYICCNVISKNNCEEVPGGKTCALSV